MDTDAVHIALSPWDLSDDYNRHSGTTLVSILDNCSRKVIVHLLYEEKFSLQNSSGTETNLNNYHELGKRYDAEILTHPVVPPKWVSAPERKNLQHLTPRALLRLYLPSLLPNVTKIIYQDCDMIVKTYLSKLWDVSLEGHSLGVCLDAARYSNVKYYQDIYSFIRINWKTLF